MENNTQDPRDANFGKKYTEDEIRKLADEFCEKHLPKWEKYCEVCKAKNCENNETCIKCGCQF